MGVINVLYSEVLISPEIHVLWGSFLWAFGALPECTTCQERNNARCRETQVEFPSGFRRSHRVFYNSVFIYCLKNIDNESESINGCITSMEVWATLHKRCWNVITNSQQTAIDSMPWDMSCRKHQKITWYALVFRYMIDNLEYHNHTKKPIESIRTLVHMVEHIRRNLCRRFAVAAGCRRKAQCCSINCHSLSLHLSLCDAT